MISRSISNEHDVYSNGKENRLFVIHWAFPELGTPIFHKGSSSAGGRAPFFYLISFHTSTRALFFADSLPTPRERLFFWLDELFPWRKSSFFHKTISSVRSGTSFFVWQVDLRLGACLWTVKDESK